MVLSTYDHFDIFASKNLQLRWLRNFIEISQRFEVQPQLSLISVATAESFHVCSHEERVSTASSDISNAVEVDLLRRDLTVA